MSKERFKNYYNESVKRYEVFDCYVNLPLSKKGIIDTLNDQQDKISDLEAKLAESEKNVEFYQERYSDATTSAYGADLIAKNIQSRLEEEIRELKQQLEETEEERDGNYENYSICWKDNTHLKQQLAEKEKENLTLFSMLYETLEKQGCENITSTIEQMTNLTLEKQSNWFKENCVKDQDKISFAVERLKKVKEKVVKLKDYSRCDKYKECWDIIIDIIIDIDNQIKQLKEGK